MFCENCGKEVDETKKVCDNCGNRLKIKKKKKPLKIILIIIAILAVLMFLFGDSEVSPIYDENGNPVYVESSNLNYIYSDTYSYLGKFVDITGIVFGEPEVSGEYTFLQMWADPENSEKNTIIYYKGNIDVKADEYIKVTGYVNSNESYTNAFGATISAPVIIATEIEKSSYMDVVSPTLKSVEFVDKVINQHGYKVEVNKVEFAENETRVYVTAQNSAKDEFSLYTYSAVVTQNGKQYEQELNYNADYEELQSDLKPGITSTGILVFPKIEQTDFKLILDGSSDNWDIDIEEYEFDLKIQ